MLKTSKLNSSVVLRDHQQNVVDFTLSNDGRSLMAHAPGTGKTLSAIAAFEKMKLDGKVNKALVITPASLRTNFEEDGVKKFTDSTSNIGVDGKSDFQIVSMAKFRRNPSETLRLSGADMVIVDEIHRAKDPQSATHKGIREISPKVNAMIGMTGSFINNHPRELVPLMDLVDPGHDLGSMQSFQKKHTSREMYDKGGFLVGPKYRTELKERPGISTKVKGKLHYIDSEDMGSDLPGVKVEDVYVPMSNEQNRLYNFSLGKLSPMERARIRRGLPVNQKEAMHILSAITKARQVSNSISVQSDVPLEQAAEDTPKIKAVMDDVEKHLKKNKDGQAVIYTNFATGGADVLKAGLEARGHKPGLFAGTGTLGVTGDSRNDDVARFKAGKSNMIILTPAAKEGVSLNNSTGFFEVDRFYNPERNRQAMARARRIGGLSHRPKEKREIEVKRYYSAPKTGWFDEMLGRKDVGVDEWIQMIADEKDRLNEDMRATVKTASIRLMPSEDSHEERRTMPIEYNYFSPVVNEQCKLAKYYKLDKRTRFQGMPVSIENDVGGVRKGTSPEGVKWETKMKAQYGYLRGTMGVDGDEIDVFIGPNENSTRVFIVHQKDPKTGKYDEDKCMLGCDTKKQARELFLEHYDSKKFLGDITELTMKEFKATAARSKMRPGKITKQRARKTKPNKMPNKEWSKAFKYEEKKAGASDYLKDFAAGMDPLGVFTNTLGHDAEKAKISETEHLGRRSLGTVGGFIGGATLVPSVIMSIIGGAKGAAQANAGTANRLTGAAKGAWEGFKMPLTAPLKAAVARKRIGDVLEKGTLSSVDMAKIYPVIEQARLGDIAKAGPKAKAVSKVVGGIMDDISKGHTFSDSIKKNVGEFNAAATHETKDVAAAFEVASSMLTKSFDPLIDGAAMASRVKSISDDSGKMMLESLTAARELAQKGEVALTPGLRNVLENAHKQSGIALAEGVSALALGGTIGAGGAYVQYGEGRNARREFEKELGLYKEA